MPTTPAAAPRWAYALLAATMALIVWWLFDAPAAASLQYDDSYIGYRYAMNLADAGDLSYNPGDHVNSASTLSYTAVLAVLRRAGLGDLAATSLALGLAAGTAALLVLLRACARASGSGLAATAIALPIALSGSLSAWATSGMETVPYLLLIALLFAALGSGRTRTASLILAAAALTRPDAVVIAAALAVAGGLLFALGRRADARAMLAVAGAGVAGTALYLGLTLLSFGEIVPYAGTFKMTTWYYNPGLLPKLRTLMAFLLANPIPALGCMVGGVMLLAAFARGRRDAPAQEIAALAAASAIALASLFGPREDFGRYLLPLLAPAALSAAHAWRRCAPNAACRTRAGRSALAAAWLAALVPVAADARSASGHFANIRSMAALRLQIGQTIDRDLPTDALILSSDLGAIAYPAPRHRVLDLFGLLYPPAGRAVERAERLALCRALAADRPAYVADTILPDGTIQAIDMLNNPHRHLRRATRATAVPPIFAIEIGQPLLDLPADLGYRFILAPITRFQCAPA